MNLLSSACRKLEEFRMSHMNAPRFLLCDAATYKALCEVTENDTMFRAGPYEKLLGLTLVVVPVPEMFCIVADPWVEVRKVELRALSRASGASES